MSDVIFESLVGGFATITGGGTKTAIKLSRPWQPPLPIAPETCPFCKKEQKEIPLDGLPSDWRLLPTFFTPHGRHRLIIPRECWDAQTLQTLGGSTKIREALEIAQLATKDDQVEMAAFIHVGSNAGQNLGHAHWHVMEVRVQKTLNTFMLPTPNQCFVKSFDQLLYICATGAHAGECLIYSPYSIRLSHKTLAEQLAKAIDWIVRRGNEKFRSTQGLYPEFTVSIRISDEGHFRYANYCPILNMWGAPEHVFAPLEGGPITLAWPHELTAEHLRE